MKWDYSKSSKALSISPKENEAIPLLHIDYVWVHITAIPIPPLSPLAIGGIQSLVAIVIALLLIVFLGMFVENSCERLPLHKLWPSW
jgi:hypothetical protein